MYVISIGLLLSCSYNQWFIKIQHNLKKSAFKGVHIVYEWLKFNFLVCYHILSF
jgi:hypothetical protein